MAKQPNKFLLIFGIIMMVAGFLVILSALPIIQQSIISAGPITATDIPTINATLIIIGSVLIILGLTVFIASFKLKR